MNTPQTQTTALAQCLLPRADLRTKLANASGRMADVWRCIKRLAHTNPEGNPWFLPFVAAMEQDDEMIAAAKQAIRNYLDGARDAGSSGYLFNIWCFAFPHCRWALWFDLLRQCGFYDTDEADRIAAEFLLIQFRDHHSGLLIKPYPECVDNQAASLALSSFVVGDIFANGPGGGNIARKMREEAAQRLEAMIGGMPKTGYSGEGSTYQGLIVAFAAPFLNEVLNRMHGREMFAEPLAPNGTSTQDILTMTMRLWMPGGLLLPWDDYGYQFGVRFPIAYLANKTRDTHCLHILEHAANWSRINSDSSGWGFDETIWTLVYWPADIAVPQDSSWTGWGNEELGATIVDPKGENYLMQMWDETGSMCCRAHVNPNSLILVHQGIPFSADGSGGDKSPHLQYDGAVYERNFGAGSFQHINLSRGCGGSHNAILVDGDEGLRPRSNYGQCRLVERSFNGPGIVGDVTNLYRNVYDDCRTVRRASRLVDNRFWVVEDFAAFSAEHSFTSRWWFRPNVSPANDGVDVATAEGALLQMRSLLAPTKVEITRVDGYPREPDGRSDRIDFAIHSSTEARWLWVLWPTMALETKEVLSDGWRAWPIDTRDNAAAEPTGETYAIHPGAFPWFQEDTPITSLWCFTRTINLDGLARPQLRLPRGLTERAQLQINGTDVDLSKAIRSQLVPGILDCTPFADNGTLDLRLCIPFPIGHAEKAERKHLCVPDQPMALCALQPDTEKLASWTYCDGRIQIETTAGNTFALDHQLMDA